MIYEYDLHNQPNSLCPPSMRHLAPSTILLGRPFRYPAPRLDITFWPYSLDLYHYPLLPYLSSFVLPSSVSSLPSAARPRPSSKTLASPRCPGVWQVTPLMDKDRNFRPGLQGPRRRPDAPHARTGRQACIPVCMQGLGRVMLWRKMNRSKSNM